MTQQTPKAFLKILSLFLLLAGSQVNAALVTFTDRTAFQSAVGAAVSLETFSDTTLETGLSLTTGGGYNYIWTSRNCPTSGDSCMGLIENSSFTFSFAPGVRAVGFDYNELNISGMDYLDSAGHAVSSALTANIYDNNEWVPAFFGVISDVSLEWITIGAGTASSGSVFFVDDLGFGVTGETIPEPSILALFVASLAGLGFIRRNRPRA